MVKLLRVFFRRLAHRKRIVALLTILLGSWVAVSVLLYKPIDRPDWADRAVTPSDRAEAVREIFKFAWEGYYENAFPNDELVPLLNSYSNSRNGWGATAIEALGTAAIMGIPEIVDQILEFIPTINFNKTRNSVDLFETTIRYLGGMLSAYDLLTGPVHHLTQKNVEPLLIQSKALADSLKFAFDTPSGIPWKTLRIDKQVNDGKLDNTASSVGTLILEWNRLAALTGNTEYSKLVEKAMKCLLYPQPSWSEEYSGIIGTWIDVKSGLFTDSWGSWGGGGDSFYEYLIKMFAYDPVRFGFHKDRWIKAAESTMKHLAETPHNTNLTFISLSTGRAMDHESSHLECFAGGNFIFAGKLLNDTQYIKFGLKIVESCHEMYIRTATRLGPEKIRWPSAPLTPKQWKEFQSLGFAISDSRYQLRPEVVESYYYAYRATNDRKYQEWAWDAFVAVVTHTKIRNGFAPISNVNKVGRSWTASKQESFFFSELLKYMYLIFAEEAEYQFNYQQHDDWVFSTEGHPFKIARTSK